RKLYAETASSIPFITDYAPRSPHLTTVGASLHKSSCVLVYHIKLPDTYKANFLKLNPHTMKILFLSVFALFISVTSAQDNAVEVIYKKGYKHLDSSDTVSQLLKGVNYGLYATDTTSRFEQVSPILISSDALIQFLSDAFLQFIYTGGGKSVYYTNTTQKIRLHQTQFMDSLFLIKEDHTPYQWELKDKKRWILGYECYKAVGRYREYSHISKAIMTRNVTVWYAPSIPFSFGPAGYDGLPGLVLASSDNNFHFTAIAIKFSDNAKKITPPDKGKRVNRKEFNKAIYEIFMKYTGKQ
ncbi:MAG: GLPGLI family protein, partial [Bacteroidota bacterium]